MTNLTRSITSLALILALSSCSQESAPAVEQDMPDEEQPAAVSDTPETVPMPRTASVEGASVFFISPAAGETLTNPITIEFGIDGMDIVKAGENQPNSGHHHLLIDTGLPDLSLPIPGDQHHVHFGDGSTTTEITLEPGTHSLQMLLGDHLHIPHNPPLVSESITITVE